MKLIGVIHDNLILTSEGASLQQNHSYLGFWNLGKLLDLATKQQIKQLWISKGSALWRNIKKSADSLKSENGSGYYPQFWQTGKWTLGKGGLKNTISAWVEGVTGSTTTIILPGVFDSGSWEFENIEDPYLLYNALELFKEKLFPAGLREFPGFPFKASRILFDQSLPRALPILPEFYNEKPADFWQPFLEKPEGEFIRRRDLTKEEKTLPYVHAFDKRMMFLSAARAGFFGVGKYEEIDSVYYSHLEKDAVGICEVEPLNFSDPFKPELSAFFNWLFEGQTRFMTPYLSVFEKQLNAVVKIKKGWVWKNTSRVFEKFAVTLGNAVKETRDQQDTPDALLMGSVNKSLKPVYTNFFGWLGRSCDCHDCGGGDRGFDKCKRAGFGGELFRPDWRALIVSLAGANLIRNIIEIYEYNRQLPFGINHDCLWYLSDTQDPYFAFDKTSLTDRNKFTHEYTLPARPILKLIKAGESIIKIEDFAKAEAAK